MLTAQFVLSHGVYPFTTPFGKAKLALEEMNAHPTFLVLLRAPIKV